MVMDGDLTRGSEHAIQCTDGVWWNGAPETYIISLTSVTPINSIKGKQQQSTTNQKIVTE